MAIEYRTGLIPETAQIIELYASSGLNRPVDDPARIARMYAESNLVITAWDEGGLVGVARSLTDFCYCCYLSDLAVRSDYQRAGIGRGLVELTRAAIGEQTTLILLSAPGAMDYYPKLGFTRIQNGYIIHRSH